MKWDSTKKAYIAYNYLSDNRYANNGETYMNIPTFTSETTLDFVFSHNDYSIESAQKLVNYAVQIEMISWQMLLLDKTDYKLKR